MDLERIKQNFRLRTGRSKKLSKITQSQRHPVKHKDSPTKQPIHSSPTDQFDRRVETRIVADQSTKGQYLNTNGREVLNNGNFLPKLDFNVKPTLVKTTQDSNEEVAYGPANANLGNVGDGDMNGVRTQSRSGVMASLDLSVNPHSMDASQDSETEDFDLRPSTFVARPPSLESIAELLFSSDHLNTLIHDPKLLPKLTTVIQKYRPEDYFLLIRYLETSKALKAVEYANAVAASVSTLPQIDGENTTRTSNIAAVLNTSFKNSYTSAFESLVTTSLPLYITYTLICTISECLIDEITGHTLPKMQDMIGGLSEAFCITDPKQDDNPIIYASEEFYRLTGYGRDEVIGRNCRFLQGGRTNPESHKRLRESLNKGEQISETLLNYKRDGRPFINVLMIAPLHDDKGNVKYHIGAQVDVSRLIESGRVLESFQTCLLRREATTRYAAKRNAASLRAQNFRKRKVLETLKELSELFDLEESAIVKSHSRSSSLDRDEDWQSITGGNNRRRLVDFDDSDEENEVQSYIAPDDWNLGRRGRSGLSGKLPGVYEKYMLIRPSPSLRIIFVSPKLSVFGNVVQNPFLSHIAAPAKTLSGLAESFDSGIPVLAKVNFMSQRSEHRYGTTIPPTERHEDGKYGRACWMSATPLIGVDDRIGVWMIVFVEKAQSKARRSRAKPSWKLDLGDQGVDHQKSNQLYADSLKRQAGSPSYASTYYQTTDRGNTLPIKPKRLDDSDQHTPRRHDSQRSALGYQFRAASPVEEYHSAHEQGRTSLPVESTPRAVMRPQTPTYGITDSHSGEFVQKSFAESASLIGSWLRIQPDTDQEKRHSGQIPPSNSTSLSRENESNRETQELEDFSPSIPSDMALMSDNEEAGFVSTKSDKSDTESVETMRQSESPRVTTLERRRSPNNRPTPTILSNRSVYAARKDTQLSAGMGHTNYLQDVESGDYATAGERRGRQRTREGDDERL